MLELGVGADIVRGIGGIVWGLLVIALLVALIKPKSLKAKALSSLLVLGIFFGPMVPGALRAHEYQQRYAKAKALFDERCKTAGEKIYRTVEGVEGVFLMKMRSAQINFADQYAMDDPYGQENPRGEDYVRSFLDGRKDAYWLTDKNKNDAFDFVEIAEENSQKITRYGLKKLFSDKNTERLQLQFIGESKRSTSYGIDWKDESSREDRDSWIACGSVSAIDLNTKEILGK